MKVFLFRSKLMRYSSAILPAMLLATPIASVNAQTTNDLTSAQLSALTAQRDQIIADAAKLSKARNELAAFHESDNAARLDSIAFYNSTNNVGNENLELTSLSDSGNQDDAGRRDSGPLLAS